MPKATTAPVPKLQLPEGGVLQGFPVLAAQYASCSAASDLLSQVAPLLALMRCQGKVLNLLKPLIDVIKGLPNPPVRAILEFTQAATDLQPCFFAMTPAGLIPLLRDLVCLEIRSLNCFLDNLRTAQRRPATIPAVLSSYPAIVGVLALAGDAFHLAGLSAPQAPPLSGKTDKASLAADAKAVQALVASLQSVADALGGC